MSVLPNSIGKIEQKILAVEEVYAYILADFQQDKRLQNILIEGEISNLYPRSLRSFTDLQGKYLYFDLKGNEIRDRYGRKTVALLHCAMWQPMKLAQISYLPKEGDAVLIRGTVTAYKDRGQLQLTVSDMQPKGKGLLLLKLLALQEKLEGEGLFAEAHKKPIPAFPMRIALLAGDHTAARADVHASLQKRWPLAQLDDYPVPVQGSKAPSLIVKCLLEVDKMGYDAIILARGGGSFEDLFYFNDEELVRTIYALKTFIVTGIGHEVDFTLAESAADLRAHTPTAAAEKITPSLDEVLSYVQQLKKRIQTIAQNNCLSHREQIERLINNPYLRDTKRLLLTPKILKIQQMRQELSRFKEKIQYLQITQIHQQQFLRKEFTTKLLLQKNHLTFLQQRLKQSENHYLANRQAYLQQLLRDMRYSLMQKLQNKKLENRRLVTLLHAYSPQGIMEKGYSLVFSENGLIKSVHDIYLEQILQLRFKDGEVKVMVKEVQNENE